MLEKPRRLLLDYYKSGENIIKLRSTFVEIVDHN